MTYYSSNIVGAQVKVSSLAGMHPSSELIEGEIAVNIDGSIFVKHNNIVYNLTNNIKFQLQITTDRVKELESKIDALAAIIKTLTTPPNSWLDNEASTIEK